MKPLSNKSLEERQQVFINQILIWLNGNDPKHEIYPEWLVQEFTDKNCELSINGKDILWEWKVKQKARKGVKASIGGALSLWKRNSQSWHPKKWQKKPKTAFKTRRMKPDQMVPNFDYDKFEVK